jgi:hypothetical protein
LSKENTMNKLAHVIPRLPTIDEIATRGAEGPTDWEPKLPQDFGVHYDAIKRIVSRAALDLIDLTEAMWGNADDKNAPTSVQEAQQAVVEAAHDASLALDEAIGKLYMAIEKAIETGEGPPPPIPALDESGGQ